MNKQAHIQFSKKMVVVAVVAAVIVTGIGNWVLYVMEDASGIVELDKAFLLFAGLVFVAYCGNSAIEKWALSKVDISKIDIPKTVG